MRLDFKRLDGRRYETLIERDGVRYRLNGPGHMFMLPHDIEHFVIEQNLRVKDGFWGSIASGAIFRGMTYLDGKRKPHVEERSRAVLKANAQRLSEVEILVSLFRGPIERGLPSPALVIHRELVARQAATAQRLMVFSEADVGRTVTAWLDVVNRSQEQPVGGVLSLIWKE